MKYLIQFFKYIQIKLFFLEWSIKGKIPEGDPDYGRKVDKFCDNIRRLAIALNKDEESWLLMQQYRKMLSFSIEDYIEPEIEKEIEKIIESDNQKQAILDALTDRGDLTQYQLGYFYDQITEWLNTDQPTELELIAMRNKA